MFCLDLNQIKKFIANKCVRKYNEKYLASFLIQGISGIVRVNRKVHNLSEEYSSSCVLIVSKAVNCVKA